jgi:hypothetical protein
MVNLMEGIIPEYDRKGKVSVSALLHKPDAADWAPRSEDPQDLLSRA